MKEDMTIEGQTFSFTLKGSWLSHLQDFGLTEQDFELLHERIKKACLEEALRIIKQNGGLDI